MSETGHPLLRLKELTSRLTNPDEREEAFQAILSLEARLIQCNAEARPNPIPMRLCCEACGKLHIDVGEFATKVHHTHTCQYHADPVTCQMGPDFSGPAPTPRCWALPKPLAQGGASGSGSGKSEYFRGWSDHGLVAANQWQIHRGDSV
jgi:hypothetical protein